MKFFRLLNLMVIMTFLTACGTGGSGFLPGGTTDTPLPPPLVTVNSAPDPNVTIQNYLEAYKADDYNAMYSLVSQATQGSITLEDFALRNRDALNEMSAGSFDYEILSSLVNPYSAEIAYHVIYHTALVGDIERDIVARLALENNEWKIQWDDSLILPELVGGNVLRMDYSIPARGNIYDRDGDVITAQSDAYALSIIPGNVTEESLGPLLSEARRLCGFSRELLADEIANTPAFFPIPLCEVSEQESERIRGLAGVEWTPYNSRYYFDRGASSNIVGFTQFISEDNLEEYRRLGYNGSERVGSVGIEAWGEDYLAGQHGGTLYVVNPTTGQIVTRVGESAPTPADSLYLTIDHNLQYYAQQSIQGFTGAAVVIEVETGRVLAMASSPGYDSNIFEPNNPIASSQIADLAPGSLLNRAAQGQYPLGSVFKIITMAAGMESGLFVPERTLDCQYTWTKLPDQIRYDWTYQHCQDRLAAGQECNTSDSVPSGVLNLQEGLMRSCNPFFWEIGYTLYYNDRPNDIANMARAFGLGQPTGIGQIEEESGQINDPQSDIAMVNMAIGQGDVLVTPLQVAAFIAAMGNGGTLYRPQLVEKIEPVDGSPSTQIFKPEARGTLPIQSFRMELLQEAMIDVVSDPRGTAYFRFRGFPFPVAGKTGTAESGSGEPHAWFAGYTLASENTGLPDIAVVVILENQGEGSDFAAPIFRRIVETYYYGNPVTKLWFEDSILGSTLTPTPIGGVPTETPEP